MTHALVVRVTAETAAAIPLRFVLETMRPLPTLAFEGAPPFVSGSARVRGEAIPVVDVPRVVGANAVCRRFVVVSSNGERFALAVPSVVGVGPLPESGSLAPLLRRNVGPALYDVLAGARIVVAST